MRKTKSKISYVLILFIVIVELLTLSQTIKATESFPETIKFMTSIDLDEDLQINKIECIGRSEPKLVFNISGVAKKNLKGYSATFYYLSAQDDLDYVGKFSFPDLYKGKSFNFNIQYSASEIMPAGYWGFMIKSDHEIEEVPEEILTIHEVELIQIVDEVGNQSFDEHSSINVHTIPPVDSHIEEEIFLATEESPEFPGGMGNLSRWISENLKYPENLKDNNVTGRVVVQIVVEKDGSISNARVIRGVNKEMDDEAIRLMKVMPTWKPAKNGDRIVRSYANVPVIFKINMEQNVSK